jgi:hypothetical protein
MKNMLLILLSCIALQSCFVNAKRDYNGYSKTLVFTKQDKWLINNIYTDLNSYDRDKLNKEVFSLFNELSSGNVYNLEKAKSQNLITGRIPFSPETEDIEQFKNSTDFNYLVNIYTKKVRNGLAVIEPSEQMQYASNEAFAIIEIYDIKNVKKIYYQKVYSSQSREKETKGPSFHYSSETLSKKNLRKILKDIKKNAIIKS